MTIEKEQPMCDQPQLGLATTHQLITELMARSEVSKTIGESWPNYATALDNR
jgi:hypothetical protein